MDAPRTPTAFHHSAQGCAPRATLGHRQKMAPTLKGLNPVRGGSAGCNPFRVGPPFPCQSQGCARRATLGWMMERRWRSGLPGRLEGCWVVRDVCRVFRKDCRVVCTVCRGCCKDRRVVRESCRTLRESCRRLREDCRGHFATVWGFRKTRRAFRGRRRGHCETFRGFRAERRLPRVLPPVPLRRILAR